MKSLRKITTPTMKNATLQYLLSALFLCLSLAPIYGNTVIPAPSTNVEQEEQSIRFIVYYQGTFEDLMNNNDSMLRNCLATYDLQVANGFEINEENKGITLETSNMDVSFEELARELSLIDAVMMVEVAFPSLEETL